MAFRGGALTGESWGTFAGTLAATRTWGTLAGTLVDGGHLQGHLRMEDTCRDTCGWRKLAGTLAATRDAPAMTINPVATLTSFSLGFPSVIASDQGHPCLASR